MKLGIFGDSYACGHTQSQHFHWYNLLAEKLGTDVETHGMGATSTFYTYNKFLENHTKYDRNIVLITHFARYTKTLYFESTGVGPQWLSAINAVDHTLANFKLTPSEKLQLEYLRAWFIVSDDMFMKTAQDLIVGKILEIRPDTVIIPSFHEEYSLLPERRAQLGIDVTGNCWTFMQTQHSALGIIDANRVEEKMSTIACHFTPEVSLAFTEAVYNKFKYNTPIVCPKQIKHDHTLDYYYEIKS